jgi:hypothetical protein
MLRIKRFLLQAGSTLLPLKTPNGADGRSLLIPMAIALN